MGASFQNYCLRSASPDEVRGLVVQWLEMKGFEAVPEPPLFDGDDVRSLVLFWNERWTTVLYSRFEELERLEFELSKLPHPLLKVWVYDSDLWGYELSREREVLAAFHSNPKYFGGREELPLPQNGNPEVLCQVCDLPGLERKIADLQRARRIFSEELAVRFCTLIGATPAALPGDEITAQDLPPGVLEVGGFRMERLFFRETRGDWKTVVPDLHTLEVEQIETPGAAELPPGMAEQVRRWQFFARVISLVLKPLILVMSLVFRAWFALNRPDRRSGSARATDLQSLLHDLGGRAPAETGRAGSNLTNTRFHCQVTLPDGVEGETGDSQFVFRFKIQGQQCWCTAVRPDLIRSLVRIAPASTLQRDEKFAVAGLQARTLETEHDSPQGRALVLTTLVQAEDAVFSFHLTTRSPAAPDLRQRFHELVQSFERIG